MNKLTRKVAVFIEHQLNTYNYDDYQTTGYSTQATEYISVTTEQFEALKHFCDVQRPPGKDCHRYYLVEDVTSNIDLELVLEEYKVYRKKEDEKVAKRKAADEKRLAKKKEIAKKQKAINDAKKKAKLMKELEKMRADEELNNIEGAKLLKELEKLKLELSEETK
jgi:hypothetical protein